MTAPAATPARLHIDTVSQLIGVLAEAAEIEHGVMCCYFFAAFALKAEVSDGLPTDQRVAVARWKETLLQLAFEEMGHLALVSNLSVSLGALPHFTRQPFPVAPGTHPADITLALAPFDLTVLDHFIFLERPTGSSVLDPVRFRGQLHYARGGASGRFFPRSQDYSTIGELYRELRGGIARLADCLGEAKLFCGNRTAQVGPELAALPGLISIGGLSDALKAIDTIVIQGEGSPQHGDDSHYGRLRQIREDYERLLQQDASFEPSRPVVSNPVMRLPQDGSNEIHIDAPATAAVLDCANAAYTLMLCCLGQAYGRTPEGGSADQEVLLDAAIGLMGVVSALGVELTRLPASPARPGLTAGLTFDIPRGMRPLLSGSSEWSILSDGVRRLSEAIRLLKTNGGGDRCAAALDSISGKLAGKIRGAA